jgi:hypothetical protein
MLCAHLDQPSCKRADRGKFISRSIPGARLFADASIHRTWPPEAHIPIPVAKLQLDHVMLEVMLDVGKVNNRLCSYMGKWHHKLPTSGWTRRSTVLGAASASEGEH